MRFNHEALKKTRSDRSKLRFNIAPKTKLTN